LPLKDLVRGPVAGQIWCIPAPFLGWNGFPEWKPWKQTFWPSPECRAPFSMPPRHALSSFMVWNAGLGRGGQRQLKMYKLGLLCSTATIYPESIEL
jgi:hypothetical protein